LNFCFIKSLNKNVKKLFIGRRGHET